VCRLPEVGASAGGEKLAVLPSNKTVAVQMLAVVQEEAAKRSAAWPIAWLWWTMA
jgi:hypothetical protein